MNYRITQNADEYRIERSYTFWGKTRWRPLTSYNGPCRAPAIILFRTQSEAQASLEELKRNDRRTHGEWKPVDVGVRNG